MEHNVDPMKSFKVINEQFHSTLLKLAEVITNRKLQPDLCLQRERERERQRLTQCYQFRIISFKEPEEKATKYKYKYGHSWFVEIFEGNQLYESWTILSAKMSN